MKKKVIAALMAASMMVGGVVSAASLWGTYKGNDVVRLTSDGVVLKSTDVPAINYEGRTMIPISMLGQIGLQYTWDNKNKTVDILKTEENKTDYTSIFNASHARYFSNLEVVGELLVNAEQSYFSSMQYAFNKNSLYSSSLESSRKMLDSATISYNQVNNASNNYADDSILNILTSYYNTIELLNKADSYLVSFAANRTPSDSENFYTSIQNALKEASSGKIASLSKQNSYLDKIIYSK